jgi:activator of HSP90 ATPase
VSDRPPWRPTAERSELGNGIQLQRLGSHPRDPAGCLRRLDDEQPARRNDRGRAEIDPRPGGAFQAWDGYITGTTLELEPGRRIVQSWRTSDFAPDDPDSRIEVLLEPAAEGTLFTLHHTNIPDGQSGYEEGWRDNYFDPMRAFFTPA